MKADELPKTTEIDDLTVSTDQQAEVKGGPAPQNQRTIVLRSSVTGQDNDLADLEPMAEVKGGGPEYLVFNPSPVSEEDAAAGRTTVGAEIRRPGK